MCMLIPLHEISRCWVIPLVCLLHCWWETSWLCVSMRVDTPVCVCVCVYICALSSLGKGGEGVDEAGKGKQTRMCGK